MFALLKLTEAGWYWDTGERFDTRSQAWAFVRAECDPAAGTWYICPLETARTMVIEDAGDDIIVQE